MHLPPPILPSRHEITLNPPLRRGRGARALRALATLGIAILLGASLIARARADDSRSRNFYDVLEDVMGDFEYDVKNGNVTGLKDLAIRNIAMSENVPPSFRAHLELLVTERILRNSRTRVVQCLPCRARKTQLSGDQVVVSSAENNPVELSRIAKQAGILNFMDLAFSYQPGGMVLSMTTSEPDTGAVVWSRSYNSETSRAAAFRRGVDFSQGDDARKQTEYTPVIQYRGTVYYLFEPNFNGTSGTVAFGFRAVERYDNRKKEVGFELDTNLDTSSLVGGGPTSSANLYANVNLTLLFMHSWNLIGDEENFNKARGNYFLGVGGTYASGYLGALIRTGYEWRLGKHYGISGNLGYRPSSTVYDGIDKVGTISGLEFGLGVSLLF